MKTKTFYAAIFLALIMTIGWLPVMVKAVGEDDERIFLRVSVPRTQIYVGERVPITISLYVSELNVTQVYPPLLQGVDFSFEESIRSSQSSEELEGRSYHVVRFFTAGTPLVTGNVTLNPITVQCSLSQFQTGEGVVVNPFRYQMVRGALEVTSSPLRLRVNPLPEAGRPADFSGGVGQFNIRCGTAATDIREGEPFTIRLTVSGNGNFQSITSPVLDDAKGFKIFPPRRRSADGEKIVYEQTVVPLDASLRRLGPYRLVYFNPNTRRYETAVANLPLRIAATPDFRPDQAELIGEEMVSNDGERLAEIKVNGIGLEPVQPWLIRQAWFWWLQLVPIVGLVAAFGLRRYRRGRANDPRVREKEAVRLALQRLENVNLCIEKGQYDAGLNQLYELLREFLAVKWGPKADALIKMVDGEVRDFTSELDADLWEELQSFLAGYHQSRFAGTKPNVGQIRALLETVRHIINALSEKGPVIRHEDGKISRQRKEARS